MKKLFFVLSVVLLILIFRYSKEQEGVIINDTVSLINIVDHNISDVEWVGEIFAVIQGGNAYAFRASSRDIPYPEFAAYFPNDRSEFLSGTVLVKGRVTSIDCEAYRSIFNVCVPWVEIESMESMIPLQSQILFQIIPHINTYVWDKFVII